MSVSYVPVSASVGSTVIKGRLFGTLSPARLVAEQAVMRHRAEQLAPIVKAPDRGRRRSDVEVDGYEWDRSSGFGEDYDDD